MVIDDFNHQVSHISVAGSVCATPPTERCLTSARLNDRLHGPVEREIVKLIQEQGSCTLDRLRAEISRRLRLRRWLSKPDVRSALLTIVGKRGGSVKSNGEEVVRRPAIHR